MDGGGHYMGVTSAHVGRKKAMKRSYSSFLSGIVVGDEWAMHEDAVQRKRGKAAVYRSSPTTVVDGLQSARSSFGDAVAYPSSPISSASGYDYRTRGGQNHPTSGERLSPWDQMMATAHVRKSSSNSITPASTTSTSSSGTYVRRATSVGGSPMTPVYDSMVVETVDDGVIPQHNMNNMSPGTAMSTQTELMCGEVDIGAHYTSAGARRIDDFFRSDRHQLRGIRVCDCTPGSYCKCASMRMEDGGAPAMQHSPLQVGRFEKERGVASGYGKMMEQAHVRSCPSCTHTAAATHMGTWAHCSYCSKVVCTTCVEECERCTETFCRFCTTRNYSGVYAATMCIECNNAAS